MGFCIFNNVAIAGLYARKKHGAERIAVVDFDVHHGNGTQDIFWSDKNLFFGSTHQMPLYPGTGALSETGVGNIWNAPLRPGDGGEQFKEAFESRILPALRNFAPDSCSSPPASTPTRTIHWQICSSPSPISRGPRARSPRSPPSTRGGRLVSMLEGGYNLAALAQVGRRARQRADAGRSAKASGESRVARG